MIHVVGDSHTEYTFAGVDGVTIHHLGPMSMKRIGRGFHRDPEDETGTRYFKDTILTNAIRGMELESGDVLIFSCGEGETRCFIKPQLECNILSLEELLQILVDRYLDRIKTFARNGVRVGVLCITPPTTYERAMGKYEPAGTDEERVHYTRVFNRILADGCRARGLLFVDTYSSYANERGMLIEELSDGGVHIGDTSRVRPILVEMGLL
jgi:hypothetical protein